MKLEIVKKFTKQLRKLDLTAAKLVDVTDTLLEHLSDATSLRLLAIGLFPFDPYKMINKPKLTNEIDNLIRKLSKYICKKIKTDIWIKRNTIALRREWQIGISRKMKLQKPTQKPGSNNHTPNNLIYEEFLPPLLQRYITDWIQ